MHVLRTKRAFSILLVIASLSIIVFRWERFIDGLRFQSLDHLIASTYLLFIFIAALIFVLSARKQNSGRGQKPSVLMGYFEYVLSKKLALASIIALFFIFSVALLSPLISPYDPNEQPDTLTLRYLPPLSHIQILIRSDGSLTYANDVREDISDVHYRRADRWESVSKSNLSGSTSEDWEQKRYYLLGTDKFGRDILSRIIYGSRVSLTIGIIAVLIAATFGSMIGSISGFFGSAIDSILMRIVDIMLSFPRIFLILLIVALFKPSLIITIVVLGVTGWMGVSRLVRSQTLSLRETDFIKASQAMGQTDGKIILKHLIPNTSSTIIVDSTLRIGNTILIEASLSFLGLGVPPPTPSWGSIISDGRDALLDGWWISTFPGLALVVTVVAFNLFGDSLREFLSPRTRRS